MKHSERAKSSRVALQDMEEIRRRLPVGRLHAKSGSKATNS